MSKPQKVTSDKRQIPAHYVQLSSYGCNARGRPATPEYLALHSAWSARRLGGWKLMTTPTDQRGPIYVDPNEADAVLQAVALASEKQHKSLSGVAKDPTDLQCESVCESLADIATSLAGVERLLERLATAVESIATAPKQHEPAGSWRDMNGELMN